VGERGGQAQAGLGPLGGARRHRLGPAERGRSSSTTEPFMTARRLIMPIKVIEQFCASRREADRTTRAGFEPLVARMHRVGPAGRLR
jgi:hypothetical protein